MKLKYKFVIREVGGEYIAVAVGRDNEKFRGMIRLNDTGSFIFERLARDTTAAEIAAEMIKSYDVSEADAINAVCEFAAGLKQSGLIDD